MKSNLHEGYVQPPQVMAPSFGNITNFDDKK